VTTPCYDCRAYPRRYLEAGSWCLRFVRDGSHRRYKHPDKPGRVTVAGKPALRFSCTMIVMGGPGMAGPGDEIAAGAGGQGRLRASRADREQVVEVLKAAFVEERLDRDEFELRVGRALGSRTYADLAALTADIPAGLAGARRPKPARESVNKEAAAVVACATVALAGMLAAMAAIPGLPFVGLAVVILVFAVPTGWVLLLHDWLDKRAGRQSAQGLPPGAGGEPSQRPASADPAGQFPSIDHGQQHWLLALKRQVGYRRKYSHGGAQPLAWATADTLR
jgi:hypothetical protein